MATAASAFSEQKRAMPWWIPLIEGIALLIVGVLLLTSPIETTLRLTRILGLFWFVGGIFEIVSIFIDRSAWGWKLICGIIGLWAGYYPVSYTHLDVYKRQAYARLLASGEQVARDEA